MASAQKVQGRQLVDLVCFVETADTMFLDSVTGLYGVSNWVFETTKAKEVACSSRVIVFPQITSYMTVRESRGEGNGHPEEGK